MPETGVSWIMLVAAAPYVAIAGYDFWLHKSDRSVPRVERRLHAVILASVGLFIVLAAAGRNTGAALALFVLMPAAVVDEVGYHGHLRWRERRVHIVGGISLLAMVGVWLWVA